MTGYHVGERQRNIPPRNGFDPQMRLACLLLFAVPGLHAQLCPPGRILPAGVLAGTLDGTSCFLSDSTAYSAYRLDLPTRGQMAVNLATTEDFQLLLRDSSGAKIDSGTNIRRPMEAGSYTVLVNARVPGQVGQYSVTTAFTAEPGLLCSDFPSLGTSQTIAGVLGSSGCTLPDGTRYDAYGLTTPGAGELTVSVTTSDFAPAIFIRSPDGVAIAAGDATVTATVDGNTRYEVVVATNDNAGSYQLTTSFQVAEGETCRPLKTLSGSATDTSAITTDGCAATLPGSSDFAFYNYYSLAVPSAGVVDISVDSQDFAASLHLLDDSGNVIASSAQIHMQLRPGAYSVQVFSSIPSGGAYQLHYEFTPGPPLPCSPAAADIGEAKSATLSPSSCSTELGPADLYSISLPGSGTLDLTLTTDPDVTGALAIRDLKDNLMLLATDPQGPGATRISADLPAGTYSILAAGGSASAFYQLTSKFTAREIPPCTPAQVLDINGGYVQRLGPGSCRGANGGPVDFYEFTLPSDAVVAMILTSSELDGYLSLTDSSGTLLRSDDDSYGFGDPLIVQYLRAGTYRLAARAASGTQAGLYEVDVRSIFTPRPSFCAPRSTLAIGSSIAGSINLAGCQYPDATFADVYKFEVADSTTVDIKLNSAAFDAYLLLLDSKGNLVDQDDNSGGSTNARLNVLLPPGTYYVVAKPVSDYTAGGAYTLSLQNVS